MEGNIFFPHLFESFNRHLSRAFDEILFMDHFLKFVDFRPHAFNAKNVKD